MSTSSLGRLTLDLVAQTAGFVRGMNQAERASEQWRRTVERNVKIAGAAIATTGAAAAAGITVAVSQALERMDEMSKAAQRIGTATENIAGLQLAFELGGSSAEAMQGAMVKLADKAAEGSAAFEALGIHVRATDGSLKDTRALIAEVADKFAGYADGAQKTALAVELFGRTGAELIPILNGGAAGFADMDEQARKLGLTIDNETAKAAEYFNDQLALVKMQAQGLATQFTVGLMPSLIAVADGFFATADSSDSARAAGAALGGVLVNLAQLAMTAAAAFRELTVRIADAFNRSAAWANKTSKNLDARLGGSMAGYLADMTSMQPGVAKAAHDAEIARMNNPAAQQQLAATLAQNTREYEAAIKAADEALSASIADIHDNLTAGLQAMQQSAERTRTAHSEAARGTLDRLRKLPQAPGLPGAGGGGGRSAGGGRRSAGRGGGGRSIGRDTDRDAQQFARLLANLREEGERLQHALDQMALNDGLVSQYDRLTTLQRDMRHNAEQYKGLTAEQTSLLEEQAAVVDALHQRRAVAEMGGDNARKLDDMRFEIEMLGKTAEEVARLTFHREQEQRVKELSAGASADTIAALQAEAQQVKNTYDELQRLRETREAQLANAGFAWSDVFRTMADDARSYTEVMKDGAISAFNGIGDAIGNLVATGKANFRDMAVSVLQDMSKMLAKWAVVQAVTGIAKSFGFGGFLPQAAGGAWLDGVQFFARGGVVSRPTLFGHAGGLGVMGEAGAEAIMPLKRGRNGKLGVQLEGGGGQNITINHTTIINNADGSSTTESDAPAAYKLMMDAHFDKRLADALRPGAALDSAIKQRAR